MQDAFLAQLTRNCLEEFFSPPAYKAGYKAGTSDVCPARHPIARAANQSGCSQPHVRVLKRQRGHPSPPPASRTWASLDGLTLPNFNQHSYTTRFSRVLLTIAHETHLTRSVPL